jgi:hypothetical protein
MPRWKEWAIRAQSNPVLKQAAYPFPQVTSQFLGVVIQKFRPRSGRATVGFQSWIDAIQLNVSQTLFPALEASSMVLPKGKYKECAPKNNDIYTLAEIADFNTLIAKHQDHSVPVFSLEKDHLEQTGTVLEQSLAKVKEFSEVFDKFASRVVCLTK